MTINRTTRSKFPDIHTHCRTNRKSEDYEEQNISHLVERKRGRRNAAADTNLLLSNANKSHQRDECNQLAERIRELEKEIIPDRHNYPILPIYSPYSAATPTSSISGCGMFNYSHLQNFSLSLISPSSAVPTQRFGLSGRILERAHQIPER